MDWAAYLWHEFIAWVNSLSKTEVAILGAVGLLAVKGLGQHVLLPAGKWAIPKLGRAVYPWISGAFLLDRLIALPRYLASVERDLGRLRNPWIEEGQKLTDIYVPVSVSSGTSGASRFDLNDVVSKHRAAVIIGDAGSGKTTALKSIGVACIAGSFATAPRKPVIPVFVSLRSWAAAACDFDSYVIRVFESHDFPRPERLVARLRSSGRLAFLLDGLDEADENRRAAVTSGIHTLLEAEEKHNRCRVYITSRPVAYDGQFSDLVRDTIYMADFTPADMKRFIGFWDYRPPKSSDHLIQALMSRPPILAICRNPLMLTIVTSLYRETDYRLPDSRDEFYKVCIDALLRRWDAVKSIEDRNCYPAALKEAFLQELAFAYLAQAGFGATGAWFLSETERFLSAGNRKDIDASRFLDEVLRSGMIGRLQTGEYYFAHKTFAEALASSRLRNRASDLLALWRNQPAVWLEVCSLFVADPRTAVADITLLLADAQAREDWASFAMLAGEAHAAPAGMMHSLFEVIENRPDLWDHFDRRCCAALARLGDPARRALTAMLRNGSAGVCERVIYALGFSSESWAIELIKTSLADPYNRESAATALSALGDDALPIVSELLKAHSNHRAVALSCIEAALAIGGAAAIGPLVPLLWSANRTVAGAATVALCVLEQQPGGSEALAAVPEIPPQPGEVIYDWAFPFAEGGWTVRLYSRILDNMRALCADQEWIVATHALALMDMRLMIPEIVVLGPTRATASFFLKIPDLPHETLRTDALKKALAVTHVNRSEARTLWSQVNRPDRPDIAITGSWKVGGLSLLALMAIYAPITFAASCGIVSKLWETPLIVLLVFIVIFSIPDRAVSLAQFYLLWATSFVSPRELIRTVAPEAGCFGIMIAAILLPAYVAGLTGSIHASLLLGHGVIILPILAFLYGLLPISGLLATGKDNVTITLVRRSNPLRALVEEAHTSVAPPTTGEALEVIRNLSAPRGAPAAA